MGSTRRWLSVIVAMMLLMSTVTAVAAYIDPVLCSEGNPTLQPGGVRINDPMAKTYYRADFPGSGLQVSEPVPADFWIKITLNADKSFNFESNYYMDLVVVKGGSDANCYNYYDYSDEDFYPVSADTFLYAPNVPSGPAGLSHLDFYFGDPVEELEVTKTAETAYVRTHEWDIDKRVETDNGDVLEDGTPKIWLLEGYNEEEGADWYVDVDYIGFDDSDFEVCGEVTIENTGAMDVSITSIVDLLGGSEIDLDFGEGFELPYVLGAGETLVGTYCEDGYVEGKNVVTVSTANNDYSADADIVWGDPTTELYKTITVIDESDLFGEVELGTLTEPVGDTFTYDEMFYWADFAPGSYAYDNTATIVETGQYAEALLKINVLEEELTVTKTADTAYVRTHEWDIDKRVETDNGDVLEDGTPKIWLLEGYNEEEGADWYVDVDYIGFDDSDFEVCGEVTIKNTGTQDAVIKSIVDLLGGSEITVDFGEDFEVPYTLKVGETLVGTYCEDGYVEGKNEVTVTTEVDVYDAEADIVWGDPTTELYKTITVIDESDLFGEVELGTLTEPVGDTFTYDEMFYWADFAPGSYAYDNTATIVETGQYAEALLKINVLEEDLTVTKTAVTSFERTHKWDIDKKVETDNGYFKDGLPKIWLWSDGSGDEWATWYVDVTYKGFDDSDQKVCGEVTIKNTGTQDAVIKSIVDLLGGSEITVDFGEDFEVPYTLKVGETLVGTYCEDGYVEGKNEVTVTTEVDVYDAEADIVWGDPDEEYLKTVNVKDISDLPEFGEQDLGSVTAPNDAQLTYSKYFAWVDYDAPGPYIYKNTATIVETEQSADATLKVNWDTYCWKDDTAWAYGAPYAKPNWDYVDNEFWGWTNGPLGQGSYMWPIYAGAGQNDLSKGTIVGTLYVDYVGDVVTVKYELFAGNALGEVHLWVGDKPLPYQKRGKTFIYTNAPGQFPYKSGSFGFDKYDPATWESEWTWSGSKFKGELYVAAHAVVWQQVQCPNVIE